MKEQLSSSQQNVVRVAQGGGIAFGGRLLALALNFLLAVILARNLGEELYGLYVVGFSLVTLVGSFSLLGLNRGTIRFIARFRGIGDRSQELGTFKTAVTTVIISGAISATLIIILARPLANLLNTPPEFANQLWGFALWMFSWAILYELSSVLEAIKYLEYRTMIVDVGWLLARVILVGAVLWLGGGLTAVIGASLAATLLAIAALSFAIYHFFWRDLKSVKPSWPVRQLITFSLPVMVFSLLNLSQNQIEIYMLTALQSSSDAGVFSVAARTSVLITAFLEGAGMMFAPFASDLSHKRQTSALKELLAAVTQWSFTLGLLATLLMILFRQPILSLFGEGYVIAAPVLIILATGQLINAFTGPVGIVLTMSGHQNLNLINSALTLTMSIVLGLFLIPRLGIIGAAISSSLATSLVNLLRLFQVQRIFQIWVYNRQFIKPIIAGLGATFATYVVIIYPTSQLNLLSFVLGSLLFVGVYSLIMFKLGLNQADLLIIDMIRSRLLGKPEPQKIS